MSDFKHITISYTSPYLVATPKGYTKHYYAESERIASKIGGENFRLTIFDFRMNKLSSNEEYFEHNITAGSILSTEYHTLPISQNRQSKIENRQSYHPDHLGSSSWITYTDGKSIQHLHYLPFGESFVDQRISSFGSKYTFSAKEKDVETGYGYFGARYYSSDLSIWLSVDPMSDKYPTMSPYVYCADNPVKLVDPNGREVIVTGTESDAYVSELSTKNLKISKGDDGVLSYEGKAKTRTEKMMVNAIDDKNITVNICAENTTSVENVGDMSGNYGTNGGSFLGTVYDNGKVNTYQQANPKALKKMGEDIGVGRGMFERHELTESYQAGVLSLQRKISSPRAGVSGSFYSEAHNMASFAYDVVKTVQSFSFYSFNRFGLIDPFNKKEFKLTTYSIGNE